MAEKISTILDLLNNRITNVSPAISANDAVNLSQLNSSLAGKVNDPVTSATGSAYIPDILVRAASTANVSAISGTQTIDGIALGSGDFVLLKNQTTASQNGVWKVGAGVWTRAEGFDTDAEIRQRLVLVIADGTTSKIGYEYICTNVSAITVGTTSITFAQVPFGIGTGASNAAAGNHSHTSIATTADSSFGGRVRLRATLRTASATTGTGDMWVVFTGTSANQVETMFDGTALNNNSGFWLRYTNYSSNSWSIANAASNTINGTSATFILSAGYSADLFNTADNVWITTYYGKTTALGLSDVSGLTAALGGKQDTIIAGTTAQYWRGDKTWATLDKASVGLGNVDNTSDANKLVLGVISADARAVPTTPETKNKGLYYDFKNNGTNGLNDGGMFHGLLTLRQYGATTDWTGGRAHQIAMTDNTNLYHRSGTGTAWDAWYQIWTSKSFNPALKADVEALDGKLSLSGGTMTGPITTPSNAVGITVGDDVRLADRNNANTLFVEGTQNSDRGYINFSTTTGNALGAVNGGLLTWRGNQVWDAASFNPSSKADASALASYSLTTHGHDRLNQSGSNDANSMLGQQSITAGNSLVNRPFDWANIQQLGAYDAGAFQIAASYSNTNSGYLYFRSKWDGGTWGAWRTIWHSGNFDLASKANAVHTHTSITNGAQSVTLANNRTEVMGGALYLNGCLEVGGAGNPQDVYLSNRLLCMNAASNGWTPSLWRDASQGVFSADLAYLGVRGNASIAGSLALAGATSIDNALRFGGVCPVWSESGILRINAWTQIGGDWRLGDYSWHGGQAGWKQMVAANVTDKLNNYGLIMNEGTANMAMQCPRIDIASRGGGIHFHDGAERFTVDNSGVMVTGRMDVSSYIYMPAPLVLYDNTYEIQRNGGAVQLSINPSQITANAAVTIIGSNPRLDVQHIYCQNVFSGIYAVTCAAGDLVNVNCNLGTGIYLVNTSAENAGGTAYFSLTNGVVGTVYTFMTNSKGVTSPSGWSHINYTMPTGEAQSIDLGRCRAIQLLCTSSGVFSRIDP